MKLSLTIIAVLMFSACNKSAEVTSGSSAAQTKNAEAPYIWGDKSFPKVVRVSTSFTDPKEVTAIQEMANAWKTNVGNVEWIRLGATISTPFDINEDDGVIGIYKATTWPSDISSDALAITNIFGRRYNVGKAEEYVKIIEADIIMNYSTRTNGNRNFDFDYLEPTDPGYVDSDNYDFRGVVLHEMGHFLGLQHIPTYDERPDSEYALDKPSYKETSVMYPSVSVVDAKRIPQSKDRNALAYKYGIAGAGSFVAASATVYTPKNNDQGESTRIVIELRKSGECIHKEDGAVVKRHLVNLK